MTDPFHLLTRLVVHLTNGLTNGLTDGVGTSRARRRRPVRSLGLVRPPRLAGERGQASVEYALVLLGAGILASLLIAWAARTKLLDEVLDYVMTLIKGKAQA